MNEDVDNLINIELPCLLHRITCIINSSFAKESLEYKNFMAKKIKSVVNSELTALSDKPKANLNYRTIRYKARKKHGRQ